MRRFTYMREMSFYMAYPPLFSMSAWAQVGAQATLLVGANLFAFLTVPNLFAFLTVPCELMRIN